MDYTINPDRTQPWNALPELPIAESLYQTVEVYEQLAKARGSLGKLQGRSIVIPNQGMLINTISLQEAKASSAIENIFTTDDELYKAYSEQNNDQAHDAPKEILRYREALWEGQAYLQNNEFFDENYFVSIYQQIKQTTDAIRPPIAHIYIKKGGVGAGKPYYTPPRGKGIVKAKLANLITFLNDDEKYPVDPLIKMAIGHLQFEAIHPFRDGNGRAGRIFNINYITHKGYLDFPILFLSKYIIDNKDTYYSGLAGVTQRADWKTWILYMLKAVEFTANITYEKINDIINAKEAIVKAIIEETKMSRPEQLTNMIFTQPFTRVKHLTEQNMYAENTARKYLNRLTEMGILENKSIQGNHYYLNMELHRILSE